ncbi:hypothetical protein C8Q72DRAFT_916151 [Fomitopsis betulina]|nr:hypothetical protein C8Q72DRAFT_916151 [Fomitopsis betulina]
MRPMRIRRKPGGREARRGGGAEGGKLPRRTHRRQRGGTLRTSLRYASSKRPSRLGNWALHRALRRRHVQSAWYHFHARSIATLGRVVAHVILISLLLSLLSRMLLVCCVLRVVAGMLLVPSCLVNSWLCLLAVTIMPMCCMPLYHHSCYEYPQCSFLWICC